MKTNKINEHYIFSIITGILTAIFILAWLVLLIGNDEIHYVREGQIISIETDTVYNKDSTNFSTRHTYHYLNKNNEEVVQSSRDMDMNSEYYVKKYNNKYFYSYVGLSCHFIYLVLAIFCGIIHLYSIKSENDY